MVNYVLLENYTNMTLAQLFQYPTTGDAYFYVYMILGLVFVIASTLYFSELNRKGESNFLSSLAISCFAGIVISFIGSLFGLLNLENTILLFVLQLIPIALWWFGTK